MSRPQFTRCNIFRLRQRSIVAHDGNGEVSFVRIASAENLEGDCNFIDFTRVPAGATIGRHTHGPNEEEFYLILSGRGQMTVDGETFPVGEGDLVRNRPGGTHELMNTGTDEIRLFVFEVGTR